MVCPNSCGGSPSAAAARSGGLTAARFKLQRRTLYRIRSQSKIIHAQQCPDAHFRQPQRTRAAPARQDRGPDQRARTAVLQALSDTELQAKTDEFRQRLADGAKLDSLLPEAFATVREASRRVLGLRHYDVQLIGGMVLHTGKIAEMRTGEGKTLVAHAAGLPQRARRQGRPRGHGQRLPGAARLGVDGQGLQLPRPERRRRLSGMDHGDKRAAYAADITYGTNNEFGFDYLRDNMALSKEQRYQRGLNFAIVDEVDSILIDEARTPLIISGPSDESPQLYVKVNRIVPRLTRQEKETKPGEPPEPGDYYVDEKQKQVHLSEEGMEHAEELLRADGIIGEERRTLRLAAHRGRASPQRRAARERDLPARRRLHRARRRSHHRRRVHRPHAGGPALVRWPASGGRGEGRRADPAREPDARLDHVPEPLPHVQEAGRHDRHGRHGSLRIPADLRPRSRGDPDPPADGAQGRSRRHLPQVGSRSTRRSSRTSRTATSAASRCWSARPRSRCPSCCPDLLQEAAASRTKC